MNCLRAGAALVLGALVALAPVVASAQQEPGPAVLPADATEGLPPIVAQDDPWSVCAGAIAAAEPASNLPPGLLLAISLVESGRRNPETGLRTPWPWSWNAGGESGYAETREEAIAAVRAIIDEGQRSVDIGCMQVNMLQHPTAFASVEEAFDPARNVAYAIRFLHRLRARHGQWARAIADYHSGTPSLGQAYHRRVLRAGQSTGVDTAAIAMPMPPPPAPTPARASVDSLCAAGFRPLLVLDAAPRARAGKPAQRPRPRLVCQRPRPQYAAATTRGAGAPPRATQQAQRGPQAPARGAREPAPGVRDGSRGARPATRNAQAPARGTRETAQAPYRVAVMIGRDPALLPLPPTPPSRQPAARLSPSRTNAVRK